MRIFPYFSMFFYFAAITNCKGVKSFWHYAGLLKEDVKDEVTT